MTATKDDDLRDTRMMSQQGSRIIHKRLKDPSKPLFDIDQGHIGDCLLSTLNAYNQTEEGRKYLASLVTPHYTRKDRRVLRGFRIQEKQRMLSGRHAVWRHSRENAQRRISFRLREKPSFSPRWERCRALRAGIGELLSDHHAENLGIPGDPRAFGYLSWNH